MNILKQSHKFNIANRINLRTNLSGTRAFSQVLGNSATKNDASQVRKRHKSAVFYFDAHCVFNLTLFRVYSRRQESESILSSTMNTMQSSLVLVEQASEQLSVYLKLVSGLHASRSFSQRGLTLLPRKVESTLLLATCTKTTGNITSMIL